MPGMRITNMLRLQLLLQRDFLLVQPAELVDFVLILSPNLDFVTAGRRLVFFRKLEWRLVDALEKFSLGILEHTNRRCILALLVFAGS